MALQTSDLQALFGTPLFEPSDGPRSSEQQQPGGLRLCTDSRLLEAGQVFIPLVGDSFDGHHFVPAAIEAGAVAVLISASSLTAAGPLQPDALIELARQHQCLLWRVDDTLDAYQRLAAANRQQLKAKVVAVTGSAGKTTTRELIKAALAPLGQVWASSGNENNDIGVPLTLLGAGAQHAAVVVEMGMRGLGEIDRLSRCAQPDVAVITNIGTAHIGRLGSREAIATAKCEIVSALRPAGLVVIPAGDPRLEAALAQVWSGRVLRVALSDDPQAAGTPPADLRGVLRTSSTQELELSSGERLPLPLPGRHNARNLLLAVAVAQELGLQAAELAEMNVQLPGGRNRRLQLGGLTVLDETYNASPEAVLAALELLKTQSGRHFAVLGTMLELGEQSVALHRQVAARAAELALDGLVIVDAGAEGRAMAAEAATIARLVVVERPEQAAAALSGWLLAGDTLLLKASRGVALERLIPLLPSLVD